MNKSTDYLLVEKIVDQASHERRLSDFLRKEMDLSGSSIKKAKKASTIFVDGTLRFTDYILSQGQLVSVKVPKSVSSKEIVPVDLKLDIVYEDSYLIAINKRADLICHPLLNDDEITLANGLRYLYPNMGIHPISRLDRDTSGLVLYAKHPLVHFKMAKTPIEKEYIGMVIKIPEKKEATISLPIARVPNVAMLRQYDPKGRHSVTHYKTLIQGKEGAVLSFILETGRTHQIRVHCKENGFPIIHDDLYGEDSYLNKYIDRQALHSYQVNFKHPFSQKDLNIVAKLHPDMENLQKIIEAKL